MMYLSKEANIKNQSFKMQMLLSIDNDKKAPSEKIWAKNEFFRDQRADLTIFKPNFPENTLLYANQGIVSTMKDGDDAIYLDYVVLGELIPVNNPPENLDNYELKPNEVFIYLPHYKTKEQPFSRILMRFSILMVSTKKKAKDLNPSDLDPLKNLSTIPAEFHWSHGKLLENDWNKWNLWNSSEIPLEFQQFIILTSLKFHLSKIFLENWR